MLQSAFFSEPLAIEASSPRKASRIVSRTHGEKGSYSRLREWARALFARNEIGRLNDHLLRDIGLM